MAASSGFWRTVDSTYGITRLVSLGKEPTAVPLDLVSQLMLRCGAKGKLLPSRLLQPGDQVSLIKGPYANFAVEVEKIAPDRRVWVLMDLMGGQTRIAVGADQPRAARLCLRQSSAVKSILSSDGPTGDQAVESQWPKGYMKLCS